MGYKTGSNFEINAPDTSGVPDTFEVPDTSEKYKQYSLEQAVVEFIRDRCEGLRFDDKKVWENIPPEENLSEDRKRFLAKWTFTGTSLKENQIPYNKQMNIDRLCLEKALERFLKTGKKEDAFDVYFCYLEMFMNDKKEDSNNKIIKLIELLSEYEVNGSRLLMKHRDHYSHSVYVFALGLAIYQTNDIFREAYKEHYKFECKDEHKAAYHFLEYWGMTSLFHDIGYPLELPFEQVVSYFEVNGYERKKSPFIAYQNTKRFFKITGKAAGYLKDINSNETFTTTDELFAYELEKKLGNKDGEENKYDITGKMKKTLEKRVTKPVESNYFMDHAYFSASMLFKKLFCELGYELKQGHLDALTAILIHNSLYKFAIAKYKEPNNKPLKANLHPLAYMLMLCDELQCWDRTAYGRNSRKEVHPMGCTFEFSEKTKKGKVSEQLIKAVYLFDEKELPKINAFKDGYVTWILEKKKDIYEKLKKIEEAIEKIIEDEKIEKEKIEKERVEDLEETKEFKIFIESLKNDSELRDKNEDVWQKLDEIEELIKTQNLKKIEELKEVKEFKALIELKLKAYSDFYIKENDKPIFQNEIERIVDLKDIKLVVDTGIATNVYRGNRNYLSHSSFMNLYNFAVALNGCWKFKKDWKEAKLLGHEEEYLADEKVKTKFIESFEKLSLEYKLSNINQAKGFAQYLTSIDCFYTDQPIDFELVDSFTEDELVKIGFQEHRRWLQEHYDMGWIYGTPKKEERDLVRQHWDMIPDFTDSQLYVSEDAALKNYKRLDKAEQDKDKDAMDCMLAALKIFEGVRIYRL